MKFLVIIEKERVSVRWSEYTVAGSSSGSQNVCILKRQFCYEKRKKKFYRKKTDAMSLMRRIERGELNEKLRKKIEPVTDEIVVR